MTETRRERSRELFHLAFELPSVERASFLANACAGDEGLRRDVEELLRSVQAAPTGFLPMTPGAEEGDITSGTRIAGYTILEKLGEGGMGAVYAARQSSPQREVALKVVRPGRLSPATQRRFQHEIDALGSLQHPGIAHIHEAGTGRVGDREVPFFAMELVRGVPLIDYARRHGLSTEARLELIARICDAVHHAHVRGVIHRDLKPDNVLVEPEETTTDPIRAHERNVGQPKILDFGIARIVGADGGETRVGELVGTLSYMSPEQVQGDPSRIDVRSDVYALGVLLYQLLGDRLPVDLVGCTLPEAVHRVQEALAPALEELDPRWRGDVSTIASRALAKDRDQRYQSAFELAGDLRRFLRGEPILARSSSSLYLLQRKLRRHRVVLGTAILITLLMAGFALALGLQSERNRALAASEVAARRRADEDLEQALGVLDLLTELGSEGLRDVPQAAGLRKRLLESALVYHQEFLERHGGSPLLRSRVAQSRQRTGKILWELGRTEEADGALRQALAELDELVAEDVSQVASLTLGLTQLGILVHERGATAEGEEHLRRAVGIAEQAVREDAENEVLGHELPQARKFLSIVLAARGAADEAIEQVRIATEEAESAHRREPDRVDTLRVLADLQGQLGSLLAEVGRYPEAKSALSSCIERADRIFDELPGQMEVLQNTLTAHSDLSLVCIRMGEPEAARHHAREATRRGEELVAHSPEILRLRSLLAAAYVNSSNLSHLNGEIERSLSESRRAIELLEQLIVAEPASLDHRLDLVSARSNSGALLLQMGDYENALPIFLEQREELEALRQERASHPQFNFTRINTDINLGLSLSHTGRYAQGARAIEKVRAVNQPDQVHGVLQVLARAVDGALSDEALEESERFLQAEGYLARATEFLRLCRSSGFNALAELHTDEALEILFVDPDFAAVAE